VDEIIIKVNGLGDKGFLLKGRCKVINEIAQSLNKQLDKNKLNVYNIRYANHRRDKGVITVKYDVLSGSSQPQGEAS